MSAFKSELWTGELSPGETERELSALNDASVRPLRELAVHARSRVRMLRLDASVGLALIHDARDCIEWASSAFGLARLWSFHERHARAWARHLKNEGLPREPIRAKLVSLVRM